MCKSIFKRAARDTLQGIGSTLGTAIRNAILVVLALLAVRWLGGWEQLSEELKWVISSLIALAVVLVGLFIFHLIRAPVLLDFEKKRNLA